MKLKLIVVVLITVLLLSGCAALWEFLGLRAREGETEAERLARLEKTKAAAESWTTVGLGFLIPLWPAGAGFLATFLAMRRKYRHLYDIAAAIVKGIEKAEKDKPREDAIVKRRIEGLGDLEVNKFIEGVVG